MTENRNEIPYKAINHLADKFGEDWFKKSWDELGMECQEDVKAIQDFAKRSRSYYVSQKTLDRVQWFIRQGWFRFEIADFLKIERAEMLRILKQYPDCGDLYSETRPLRKRRRSQERAARRRQLGWQISLIRRTLNLTRAGLAKKLGVQTSSVKKWETGRLAPSERYLKAIAELGHMSVEELTEEGDRYGYGANR